MSEVERERVYTHTLRARVTEAQLNMVSNMATREDITAGQLIRKMISAYADKVPMAERKRLADAPERGMRALKMGVRDAFEPEEPRKKRAPKRARKKGGRR